VLPTPAICQAEAANQEYAKKAFQLQTPLICQVETAKEQAFPVCI
jgi:hypothetical protein